jgi:hypothetical protein
MAKIVEKNSIKIGKEPVVILPLKEYKKLLKYELEKEYIDEIVKEGLKEKKEGKTESLESFLKREYPKLYENYTH